MAWDELSTALAVKLWDRGLSANDIAHRLNRSFNKNFSRNAVIGKLHRIGKSGRTSTRTQENRHIPSKPRRERRQDYIPKTPPRAPRPYLKPLPPEVIEAYDAGRQAAGLVLLLDLEDWHCRWPIGDPRSRDFGFCGSDAVPNAPYCSHHQMRAAPEITSRPRPQVDRTRPYAPTKSKESVE